MDGVCYQIVPATQKNEGALAASDGWHWLRPFLAEDHSDDTELNSQAAEFPKTRILGPIVGRYHAGTGEMDLDPPGYAGNYAMELLTAQRLSNKASINAAISTTIHTLSPPSHLAHDLERQGLAVWKDALSPETIHSWRHILLSEEHTHMFRSSGQPSHVRSDSICFYNRQEQTVSLLSDSARDEMEDDQQSVPSPALQKVFQQGFDFLEQVVWNVTEGRKQSDVGPFVNDECQLGDAAVLSVKEEEDEIHLHGPSQKQKELTNDNHSMPPAESSKLPLLRPNQGMCAWYKGGDTKSHYTWHYDNERGKAGDDGCSTTSCSSWRNFRTLTAILYLQPPDWNAKDNGGQLQCRVERNKALNASTRTGSSDKNNCTVPIRRNNSKNPQLETVKIPPLGGTVVLFDSRRIQHCVLPAHRDRFAMTQWFVSPISSSEDEQQPRGHRWRQQREYQQQTKRAHKRPSTSDTSAFKRSRKSHEDDQFCRVFPASSTTTGNHKATGRSSTKEVDDNTTTSDRKDEDKGFSFGFF